MKSILKAFRRIVAIALVVSLVINMQVLSIFAEGEPSGDPIIEEQTGLSSIYDYMEFDAGYAGTIRQ